MRNNLQIFGPLIVFLALLERFVKIIIGYFISKNLIGYQILYLALSCKSNASCTAIQDFAHYKSGVYKYITGDVMGGHAVKLIGWGTTDDGEDYWVC